MEQIKDVQTICEICGKKSIYLVRDINYFKNFVTGYMEYSPNGALHSFCKEHDRDSNYTFSGNITKADITELNLENELKS